MTATVETVGALAVPCPMARCGAGSWEPCRETTRGLAATGKPRRPHYVRNAAQSLADIAAGEHVPCDACNAEPGEPCRPGCLGYALAMGEL